jgi:hypothetical protein
MSKPAGKWGLSGKVRMFARFLEKAGIPAGRSERLAARFAHLARPESFGRVVGIEKSGKVYAVSSPGVGGGGTVFVFKGPGGVEIRGNAPASGARKGQRRRSGHTRSKK